MKQNLKLLYIENIDLSNCKKICDKKYRLKFKNHYLIQLNQKINKRFYKYIVKEIKKYINSDKKNTFFKTKFILHYEDLKNHIHVYIYSNNKKIIYLKNIDNLIKLLIIKYKKGII